MESITEKEYWKEIREIARKTLPDEWKEYGRPEGKDVNEFISERLDQIIDGHEWIIYTYYLGQVTSESRHENAYFEEMGQAPEGTDYSSIMTPLAYFAMRADVVEHIVSDDFPEPDEDDD